LARRSAPRYSALRPTRSFAPGIPGVVAPGVAPELVSEIFQNTEGPLGAADGSLYFSDTVASRTYHLDLKGAISVAREATNRGNGIGLARNGDMLWVEGDGPRLSKLDKARGYVNLLPGFRLFQPNDLIVDNRGGIYFTDPAASCGARAEGVRVLTFRRAPIVQS